MGSTVSCVTWEFRLIPEQGIRKYNVVMYSAVADQETIYPDSLSQPKFELDCEDKLLPSKVIFLLHD